MQLNQREGDKNHPGATGGNLISRGMGREETMFKVVSRYLRGMLVVEKNLREGRKKRNRCLQNRTDDIRGRGSRIEFATFLCASGHRSQLPSKRLKPDISPPSRRPHVFSSFLLSIRPIPSKLCEHFSVSVFDRTPWIGGRKSRRIGGEGFSRVHLRIYILIREREPFRFIDFSSRDREV